MKYKEFKDKVCHHLSQYNKSCKGSHNGKYGYILKWDNTNESKIEIIKKYALLNCVNQNSVCLFDGKKHGGQSPIKLHTYAHHLNSSQIMCYNFFRIFIDDNCKPTDALIRIFQKWCPSLSQAQNSLALFEYKEKGENTNFDFYMRSGNIEIFCEIKYTESNFGSTCKASSASHYEDKYAQMVKECNHLWKKEIDKDVFMHKYFQLFRNSLRAKTNEKYVFFICPNDRDDLKSSYLSFRNEYIKENCTNIDYITWEDLIETAKGQNINIEEFHARYFGY